MQIAPPVESLQRERQAGQQPDDEQAALVVVADMLQAITILSIVEAFIFNVPSTLGHVVQTAAADATRREVGEPVVSTKNSVNRLRAAGSENSGIPNSGNSVRSSTRR